MGRHRHGRGSDDKRSKKEKRGKEKSKKKAKDPRLSERKFDQEPLDSSNPSQPLHDDPVVGDAIEQESVVKDDPAAPLAPLSPSDGGVAAQSLKHEFDTSSSSSSSNEGGVIEQTPVANVDHGAPSSSSSRSPRSQQRKKPKTKFSISEFQSLPSQHTQAVSSCDSLPAQPTVDSPSADASSLVEDSASLEQQVQSYKQRFERLERERESVVSSAPCGL